MDTLINYHSVDIQWEIMMYYGLAPMLVQKYVLLTYYESVRYDNLDIIEDAYGINLRPYLRLLKSITMLKTQRLNLRNDQIKTSVLQNAKKVKSQKFIKQLR